MTYKRVWFNGVSSQVVGTDLDINTSFTIGVRFKTDKIRNDFQTFVCKNDSGVSNERNYFFRIQNTGVLYGLVSKSDATTGTVITGTTIVTDGKWHYGVLVWDRDVPELRLYLNGMKDVADSASAFADLYQNNAVFRVGTWNGGYYFNGYMSEFTIHTRALTEAEINYNYLHPNNPIRRDLAVSYVQDSIDIPAGTWVDRSGNARNGTLTNTTTSTYNRIPAGRNCLFFPTAAGSDRVDCGNGASLNPATTGTITLECWLKVKDFVPAGGAAWRVFMQKFNAGTGYEFGWNATAGTFYLAVAAGFGITSVTGINVNNKWAHVVATYTGGAATGKIYVNSVDKTSGSNALALANPATNVFIGNGAALTYSSPGSCIAAARIYNRILTAAEVAYNYAHPNNPIRYGLVLNLTPESLYGTQWVDLSGNANHGTITGAVVKNLASGVSGR